MVRKPINLSDKRAEVPKDYRDDNVPRAAANRTGATAGAESEKRSSAGQGRSPSSLPAWVLIRAADRRASYPIEREQPTTSDDFLIVSEAASILRISERTLHRHLAEGGIPHIHAGKQIRIPREALLRGWKMNK